MAPDGDDGGAVVVVAPGPPPAAGEVLVARTAAGAKPGTVPAAPKVQASALPACGRKVDAPSVA